MIGQLDLDAALALNNANAQELSWLDDTTLRRLVTQAFMAETVGTSEGLILAFDHAADYGSPHFLWFRARYPRFVYVDRVVIAAGSRGRGLARGLYSRLFARAAICGHDLVCCEVNAEPPNPASDAFHASMGFGPVGVAAAGSKTVRYYARILS